MPYEAITLEIDAGTAWLTMNRPNKRNAINAVMCHEMYEAIERLADEKSVGVVVLTGAGDAFTTGMDLTERPADTEVPGVTITQTADADGRPLPARATRVRERSWMTEGLTRLDKITIAMVNGWCVGGGLTPVLSCDLAIAADDARFSISEVNWGAMPAGLTTKLLSETLRYRDALWYILTAEVFDGPTAAEIGVVNKSVPAAELRDATANLARTILEKDPLGLAASKAAFRAVRTMGHAEAFQFSSARMALLRASEQDGTVGRAVTRFLGDKSYKPALEAYDGVPER